MPAHPKLTPQRRRRLLAIVELGESLSGACRCVGVSRQAVLQRAQRDPMFAAQLRAARETRIRVTARKQSEASLAIGWEDAASFLASEHSDRWSIPDLPPLDFDDIGDPGAA